MNAEEKSEVEEGVTKEGGESSPDMEESKIGNSNVVTFAKSGGGTDSDSHVKDHVKLNIGEEEGLQAPLVAAAVDDDRDGGVAIRLEKAYKHYGGGKAKHPVLMGLDMNVQKGQIYGLLGPSGCGKTTLLKCIVGKLELDSGSVLVFGDAPGSERSGVPGSRVGYMPQELALFGEFNIEETLTYFRRIFGMTRARYEERLDFLMKFLDLPSRTRKLINMSGGQQRRASLAVALLHEPELLILDEPTVGVDPLLRTSIWDHLTDMANGTSKKCTIVITTHYIEEARQAHRVGMMRFGKLLAEDSPENLMDRFAKNSLEDVFLELCLQDGEMETALVRKERTSRQSIIKSKAANGDVTPESTPLQQATTNGHPPKPQQQRCVSNGDAGKDNNNRSNKLSVYVRRRKENRSSQKVVACMLKTFNRMKKRVGFLIYQFLMPVIQISLFCLAIGQDPKEIPVAVVNLENGGLPCQGPPPDACPVSISSFGIPSPNEHLQNFTCRYLGFLDRAVMRPVFYPTAEAARQAVSDGHAWGTVSMDANFTADLYSRVFDSMTSGSLQEVDTELMRSSSIKISLDITNQHIAFTLQMKLVEAFQDFMKQLVTSCELPEELVSVPLIFEDPVYGTSDLTFTDFMAPGIILTIVHSMALGYSAMIIIMERNEGLLDRTWVAGVTPGQFALAHFLVSLVVNLVQVVVTLIFMIFVFRVPNEGSFFWVFSLTMLQGVAGTTIGLIISAVCETQQDATQIALGIFYPNLILSGIIWPVESMPVALRYFSYVLPQTFACEAMRDILLRGWGIGYMPVYRGFLVTIAWIVATYVIFKRLVARQK